MRRMLLVGLVLLAIAVIAAAALPWWLGAAARPVAAKYGVEFARYERLGYSRFALHDVRYVRQGVVFTAKQMEANTPLLWLFAHSSAAVAIADWRLALTPTEPTPTPTKTVAGYPSLHAVLSQTSATLRRWVPTLTAQRGAIVRQKLSMVVDMLEWRDGNLRAAGKLLDREPFALTANTNEPTLVLQLQFPAATALVDARWSAEALEGKAVWAEQPLQFHARFPTTGWLPAEARVLAENWDLPAERVKLGERYARVQGGARLEWREDHFELQANARTTPKKDVQAPPLHATVQARGGRQSFTITQLEVQAPFAETKLSAPLEVSYTGELRSPPARLTLVADLAQQHWIEATGSVRGDVNAKTNEGSFSLSIEKLALFGYRAESAQLRGGWHGTQIDVAALNAKLDATSELHAQGAFDWSRRELKNVKLDARLTPAWLAHPLPAGLAWREVQISATADGPLTSLRHSGTFQIGALSSTLVKPLDATARWSGTQRILDSVEVHATGSGTKLDFRGTLDEHRLAINELSLATEGTDTLQLVRPASVGWSPKLQVENFELAGTRSRLGATVQTGEALAFSLDAANLEASWARHWIDLPGPDWSVATLSGRGQTQDGTLGFELALDGRIAIPQQAALVRLALAGDAKGLRVTRLEFSDQGRTLTHANGTLPIVIRATSTPRAEIQTDNALEFDAQVETDSPLWALLATSLQAEIHNARAQVSLRGTAEEPRGEVRVSAREVAPRADVAGAGALPQLSGLEFIARADRKLFQLESLRVLIEGQPLTASARLPMDVEDWNRWRKSPRDFPWQRIEAQLDLPETEIIALARRLPQVPITQGRVAVQAQLANGKVTGTLRVRGAATRPIPSLGVVQDIETQISLAGQTAKVESFSARLGGEPVEMTGTVGLASARTLQLDLRATAKNLPLVRRPGLLVRSDFDLQAKTLPRGATRISGTVVLRDALVMADLAAILPSGPRGAARRPPYFAVAAEPFSRWPLDVSVTGPRAVRVRTAVFDGIASPQFHLGGTLGEPRAIGQLSVDSGRVLFPFATFEVQSGSVRLSEANPYQFEVNVNAAARRHGYDLKLEATGSLEAPRLAFTSNPPLEAADVLLMVTTGQPPADQAGTMTSQQRLTQLGTFVGRGLFKSFGNDNADRLEITAGEEISRAGRETFEAEYKLNEKWSITGEYDQYDNYNAGLKWRLYTREASPNEKNAKK